MAADEEAASGEQRDEGGPDEPKPRSGGARGGGRAGSEGRKGGDGGRTAKDSADGPEDRERGNGSDGRDGDGEHTQKQGGADGPHKRGNRSEGPDGEHTATEGGAEEAATEEHAADELRRHDSPTLRAARRAVTYVTTLTGRDPESVISIERREDGWRIGVEAVEKYRIPDTSDILAVYEVNLRPDLDLVSYRRTRRYARGQLDRPHR